MTWIICLVFPSCLCVDFLAVQQATEYFYFFLLSRPPTDFFFRCRTLSGSPRPKNFKKVHFIKNMRQHDTRNGRYCACKGCFCKGNPWCLRERAGSASPCKGTVCYCCLSQCIIMGFKIICEGAGCSPCFFLGWSESQWKCWPVDFQDLCLHNADNLRKMKISGSKLCIVCLCFFESSARC